MIESEQQARAFAANPKFREDLFAAMAEVGCGPQVWERTFGKYDRTGQLPVLRRRVWARLREMGYTYNEIAAATRAGDHTTIIHGLRKERKSREVMA